MIDMNTNFMNLWWHQVGQVMKHVIASISDVELLSSQTWDDGSQRRPTCNSQNPQSFLEVLLTFFGSTYMFPRQNTNSRLDTNEIEKRRENSLNMYFHVGPNPWETCYPNIWLVKLNTLHHINNRTCIHPTQNLEIMQSPYVIVSSWFG